MARCVAIKANGERCKVDAMPHSDRCWSHDASTADARRRRASKGGKRGGRGRPVSELSALRVENADIRERLLEGKLRPGVAAVAIQSINADARLIATAIKAREQEELVGRLEGLEASLEQRRERGAYGA